MSIALGIIIAAALVGVFFVAIGVVASNDMTQSADVRVGGCIPVVLGAIILIVDFTGLLIWLVIAALQ